ncbi:immune inhibitor A [Vibrio lentus]|nr:immune inhibitor A [Vibrio lentus]
MPQLAANTIYGHDLGPDEYDTQYTGKGEPVSYWSIMSSGSWAGQPVAHNQQHSALGQNTSYKNRLAVDGLTMTRSGLMT